MKILGLDPSVNNVGFCLLNTLKKQRRSAWQWGTWKLEGMNYLMRLAHLKDLIISEIGEFDFLVTEWPAFYTSQAGALAARQNYTIDLAGINMFIAGWFQLDHRKHTTLTASQWKGSVPKSVTQRKFFRTFKGIGSPSEHAIDATMMVHYWFENYGERFFKLRGEPHRPDLI